MPFNYEEYQQKCDTLSTDELQKEWEGYTRQIAGSSTSTATSVLCSPLTGGVSLIGLGLSAPRIHNARKKREIIEAKLQARGATHVTRKRDVAGSVALSGVVGGLTFGLLGPGTDIVATAATDGAGLAIDHTVGGAIKKSGLKDLEMKKMQEQMQMQQQYQAHQQQFINSGNVQMAGIPPPGLQFQRQPGIQEQMQIQQQYQAYQAYQQQLVDSGNVQVGGIPSPGLQFQHQPGTLHESAIFPSGQQVGLQPEIQQPQWSAYQQGGELNLQSAPQKYQLMPPFAGYRSILPGDPNKLPLASHQQHFIAEGQVPKYQQDMSASPAQDQDTCQPFSPEKTPAYTTQVQKVDSPIQMQPAPASKVEQDEGAHPAQIADMPPAPTIDEEITFLRARIMQMELEKQTAANETANIVPQKNAETESFELFNASQSEANANSDMTTRDPVEPGNPENLPSSQTPRSGPPQYATVNAQSPLIQQQPRILQVLPQTQQYCSTAPLQPQQLLQQNQLRSGLPTSSLPFFPPPPTAPAQVQNVNQFSQDQARYQQQVNTLRYDPQPQQNPTYQASISPQYIRQDSGYYSIASPMQQPTPLFQGYSQSQSQYSVEQGPSYGRSASVVSSISYPPPPSNFSSGGVQPNLAEKGYFPPIGPGNQMNNMANQQWVAQQASGVQFAYGQPPTPQPPMMGQQ